MEDQIQIVYHAILKINVLKTEVRVLVMQDIIMFLMSKLVVNVIIHGNILFKNAKLL